jgi:glycosyltransferase involved in cell wall biosynthesis
MPGPMPASPGPVSPAPASPGPPGEAARSLPSGFGVTLDAATKQLSDGSLFGGSPARVLRLTAAGQQALTELRAGPIRSVAAAVLARRLTDNGMAHPVPPAADPDRQVDVTVVIPVRDRAAMLERCLAAVAGRYPVVVVDDGSADEAAVAAVAARHGASVLRRTSSGGPAAARNSGLAAIHTELVAFLDSDCAPPPGWIEGLAAHLADPLVAAVAPRIVALAPCTAAGRYEQARGSLDLGDQAARVVPASRVSYVPTAALLARRAALETVRPGTVAPRIVAPGTVAAGTVTAGTVTPGTVAPGTVAPGTVAPSTGAVFDPALRYGEDVDLVWRLHEAGWRIRYEPSVQVPHAGPETWAGLLARRFRYGTSAAPLARRHPAHLAPLVLQPWPTVAVGAALARRPVAATAATAAAWLDIVSAVRRAGVPADGAPAAALTAVRQTWLGIGRYATQFAAPALAVALAAPGRNGPPRIAVSRNAAVRTAAGTRAAAASLLLGPALTGYAQQRPALDPVRYVLAHIADDVCYGAGVWAGCLRERTLVPVTPRISWRPVRVTRTEGKV